MAEASSKTDPRRHRPTAKEGPIMVDTSHQGKVFYFSGTFQVELYNRLENWGVLGKRKKKKKCGAESRTWTVKTGLRFRHSVHMGWSNSLRKRRYVDSVVQVSVPDPIFPKWSLNLTLVFLY